MGCIRILLCGLGSCSEDKAHTTRMRQSWPKRKAYSAKLHGKSGGLFFLSSSVHFCFRAPMASTLLHALSFPNPLCLNQLYQSQTPTIPSTLPFKKDQHSHFFSIKCTSSSSAPLTEPDDNESPFPPPVSTTLNNSDYPIEKRRRSQIIRDRKAKTDLVKGEPPNYEVGWKRTKEIKLEKPVGYVIMDFLDKLVELMDKEFGSTALLAKVGEIVAERAREEAEVLRDEGKVEDRMVTELFRVLKLMEMDLAMVKAAVKEETLNERLEQAKARCRQAILVANSF